MNTETPWRVAWAILTAGLVTTLSFAAASQNDIIIFDQNKIDLGVIVLTSAAVVLTGVTVILALAAIWGFEKIREGIVEAAAKSAEKVAERVATEKAEAVALRIIEARRAQEVIESSDATGNFADAFPRETP